MCEMFCSDEPRFSLHQTRLVYAWLGKTVNVSCRVRAHPPPRVDWLHNNMILANNRTFHIYDSAPNHHLLQVRILAQHQQQQEQYYYYGLLQCLLENFCH